MAATVAKTFHVSNDSPSEFPSSQEPLQALGDDNKKWYMWFEHRHVFDNNGFWPIIASEVGGWEDGEIEGVGIIWNILPRSRRWRQWTGAKGSKAIHFQTDVRWHGINHGRGGRWARRADLWDRKVSLFAPFLRLTVFETTDEKTNEPILLLGMWCSRRCVHLSKKTIKALAKCDWQMIQILYLAIFFGYTLSVSLV